MRKLFLLLFLLFSLNLFSQQDVVICNDNNSIFTYSTSNLNGTYTWTLNGGIIESTTNFITIDWREYDEGSYQLQVNFVDYNGCIAEPMTYDIVVTECVDFNVWIPNAFTPNDDGINKYFTIEGYGFDVNTFSMRIYDRWGELLYFTTDINKPWKGRNELTNVPYQQDVYVYLIYLTDIYGIVHEYSGSVTIIE